MGAVATLPTNHLINELRSRHNLSTSTVCLTGQSRLGLMSYAPEYVER